MQQSLAQIFHETAAAAYQAFPQQLARLVVLLAPADAPVFVSPQIAEHLTQNVAAVKRAIAQVTNEMKDGAVGLANRSWPLGGRSVNLISLLDPAHYPVAFDSEDDAREEAIFTLDHEIGHHIVRNGYPAAYTGISPHLAECAADAFAMLRHIQRFGHGTAYAYSTCKEAASQAVVFSHIDHYTAEAMERAVGAAREKGNDFFTLSLEETAELAAQIADETRLDNEKLHELETAYAPVTRDCRRHFGVDALLEKLSSRDPAANAYVCGRTIEIMKEHADNPAIVTAGKHFLGAPQRLSFMIRAAAAEPDSLWGRTLDDYFVMTPRPGLSPAQYRAQAGIRL